MTTKVTRLMSPRASALQRLGPPPSVGSPPQLKTRPSALKSPSTALARRGSASLIARTDGDRPAVGDFVQVPDDMYGIVKWVGEVPGKPGTFAGVELTSAFANRGKNSGNVNGKQLFNTDVPGAGMFVPIHRVTKCEPPVHGYNNLPPSPHTPDGIDGMVSAHSVLSVAPPSMPTPSPSIDQNESPLKRSQKSPTLENNVTQQNQALYCRIQPLDDTFQSDSTRPVFTRDGQFEASARNTAKGLGISASVSSPQRLTDDPVTFRQNAVAVRSKQVFERQWDSGIMHDNLMPRHLPLSNGFASPKASVHSNEAFDVQLDNNFDKRISLLSAQIDTFKIKVDLDTNEVKGEIKEVQKQVNGQPSATEQSVLHTVEWLQGEFTGICDELETSLRNRIEEQRKLEAAIAEIEELKTELRRQQNKTREQELETLVQQLEGEKVQLKSENEQLKGKMEQVEGENEQLKGKMEQVEGENKQLEGKMEQLEGENQRLNGEIERLQPEFERVTSVGHPERRENGNSSETKVFTADLQDDRSSSPGDSDPLCLLCGVKGHDMDDCSSLNEEDDAGSGDCIRKSSAALHDGPGPVPNYAPPALDSARRELPFLFQDFVRGKDGALDRDKWCMYCKKSGHQEVMCPNVRARS